MSDILALLVTERDRLNRAIEALEGEGRNVIIQLPKATKDLKQAGGRRTMTAETRAKVAAAQRSQWAKVNAMLHLGGARAMAAVTKLEIGNGIKSGAVQTIKLKRPPIPRQGIYDRYWCFAFERQQIFERRIAGVPPPWTDNPILQEFKFCNAFRAADRVSQYLIRDVAYHDEPCSLKDRLFQVIAFRIFSKIETWQEIRKSLGRYPLVRDLRSRSFIEALKAAEKANDGLFTGAFRVSPIKYYRRPPKYLQYVELFRDIFLHRPIVERVLGAKSLRRVFDIIDGYPGMGPFMSYQLAIDINYTDLIDHSENEFTEPGPGARHGIKKVFESTGGYTPAEIITWMVDRQEEEFTKRSLHFMGLWGRRLHAIDCQALFCEIDKYCRKSDPKLVIGNTRIKQGFSMSSKPIRLFFPPKWGLNKKLPSGIRNNNPGQCAPRSVSLE